MAHFDVVQVEKQQWQYLDGLYVQASLSFPQVIDNKDEENYGPQHS